MRKFLLILCIVAMVGLSGCASKSTYDYSQPTVDTKKQNSRVFNKPLAMVWDAAIKSIGEDFFVLDNIEKDSKIITLSYSVDNPANYIDCGTVTVTTSGGASGNGAFTHGYADRFVSYNHGEGLYPHPSSIARKAALDGKANIIFTEEGPNQTRVTINARYILGVNFEVVRFDGMTSTRVSNITFNTGQEGIGATGEARCRTKFVLEQGILDGIGVRLPR